MNCRKMFLNIDYILLKYNAGPPCRYVTPRQGVSKYVRFSHRANTTIYFGGLNLNIEREGNDREDILLPKNQTEEIIRVAKASPNPIILVILSGGGIDVSFAQNNPKIGAILWAGYPGGEGGNAIADVIFGKHNPSNSECKSHHYFVLLTDQISKSNVL